MKRTLYGMAAGLALVAASFGASADNEIAETGHQVKHVLLISVDGLHALDLTNYVATHGDSTLSALSRQGITYTNKFHQHAVGLVPRARIPGYRRFADHHGAVVRRHLQPRAFAPGAYGRLRQSGGSLPWHRGY
jgi:hypothetical protein